MPPVLTTPKRKIPRQAILVVRWIPFLGRLHQERLKAWTMSVTFGVLVGELAIPKGLCLFPNARLPA